jgi:hypothetical protein
MCFLLLMVCRFIEASRRRGMRRAVARSASRSASSSNQSATARDLLRAASRSCSSGAERSPAGSACTVQPMCLRALRTPVASP